MNKPVVDVLFSDMLAAIHSDKMETHLPHVAIESRRYFVSQIGREPEI